MSNFNALTFANLFQTTVSDASLVLLNADQLQQSFDEATLHQFPLVPTKLKTLLKEVLKDGLLCAPVITEIVGTGEQSLGSGRHRYAVAKEICEKYGVNATGKVVLKTPENEGMIQPIALEMLVSIVTVKDNATAIKFIVASNGSRTMTAPEKQKCVISMGSGTPAVLAQNKLSALLSAGIDELNSFGGIQIPLTAVTSLQIVKMCTSQIKTLVYANDEQATEFIDALVAHLSTSELPSNMARDFRPIIASFLTEVVGTEFTTDGEEVEVTYAEMVTKSITKPVAKKATKASAKDATIAELQAKLAALGVTV